MTNLLIHNYYYRYKEHRKLIKDIVDTGNYQEAKTKLESVITEHETKYPVLQRDFNYGERIIMNHALAHLNTVIDKNDPSFRDGQIIKHHSDIVKDALLHNPKSDYSEEE